MIIWIFLLSLTIFLPSDLAENSEEIEKSIVDINGDDEINVSTGGNTTTSFRMSSIFCLFYLLFLTVLVHNVTSFYLPLLSKNRLGLGLNHIKLIYLNSVLTGFVSYLAIFVLVERISEKIFITIGTVLTIIPVSIIFYFALSWYDNMPLNAAYLLFMSMIIARAVFVNFSLTCSLLSKLTPVDSASFYQSLLFTIAHSANIVSRLLAGDTFDRLPMMYTCLCLAISWLVGLIWIGFEYKNL